jgi:uncharacterized protein YdaU (DUF1376 family)
MAEFAAIPLFTDSWIADTGHLTRSERGLYMDMLILIWRSPECRIPNDLAWVARRLRVDADEMKTLESLVAEFLSTTGNWLTQKRLKREWNYTFEKRKKNIESAKSRWGNKKVSSERNATDSGSGNANAMPPHPHPHPQYSEDKSSGADAPVDPVKVMFDSGRALLVAAGKSPDAAGKILGKWRGDFGVEAVIAALGQAQREGAIDPVAFIEGCLRHRTRKAEEPQIGDRKLNSKGETISYQGTQRGWEKVYE